jgi:hypothetical protein
LLCLKLLPVVPNEIKLFSMTGALCKSHIASFQRTPVHSSSHRD